MHLTQFVVETCWPNKFGQFIGPYCCRCERALITEHVICTRIVYIRILYILDQKVKEVLECANALQLTMYDVQVKSKIIELAAWIVDLFNFASHFQKALDTNTTKKSRLTRYSLPVQVFSGSMFASMSYPGIKRSLLLFVLEILLLKVGMLLDGKYS